MGGRGASIGAGGGTTFQGELVLPDGSKIEFDGDMHYDGDDKNVTGNARKSIMTWEQKRAKMKLEYAYAVDADGNQIDKEYRGSKGKVKSSLQMHDTQDAVFSHVHPREDGILGGTFSNADLKNFALFKNKTVRAVAKEGTYSISKTKNFDKNGALKYFKKCDNDFNVLMNKINNQLASDYRGGKVTYDQYLKQVAKKFNTGLVKLHESLRSGQKQYGYVYTLEKRG